jgi:p-aminobenzoyl-glutamate transporter AbgT
LNQRSIWQFHDQQSHAQTPFHDSVVTMMVMWQTVEGTVPKVTQERHMQMQSLTKALGN